MRKRKRLLQSDQIKSTLTDLTLGATSIDGNLRILIRHEPRPKREQKATAKGGGYKWANKEKRIAEAENTVLEFNMLLPHPNGEQGAKFQVNLFPSAVHALYVALHDLFSQEITIKIPDQE